MASKSIIIVSWLLNFRGHMFMKNAIKSRRGLDFCATKSNHGIFVSSQSSITADLEIKEKNLLVGLI